jgi:hypothetical protein
MARDYMAIVMGLLAKAESTNHPDEADAFLAKAQELMSRHAIDEAMLAAAGPKERASVETLSIVCEAPYATAKTTLLHVIAKVNDCRAITVTKGADQTMQLFGYDADLAHVQALYVHLSMQATRSVLADPVRTRRYRHAFLVAFAGRIGERLEAARRRAQADYEQEHAQAGGSVGLVLADRRSEVDHIFDMAFPHARNRRVSVSSRTGLDAGRRAGDRADLGGRRLSTGTRGAIEGNR